VNKRTKYASPVFLYCRAFNAVTSDLARLRSISGLEAILGWLSAGIILASSQIPWHSIGVARRMDGYFAHGDRLRCVVKRKPFAESYS
jgi:hypothetical protein